MSLYCVCSALIPIENRTHVVILRHPSEARKSSGTAHLASELLARVTVMDRDTAYAATNARLEQLVALSGAALLYPGFRDLGSLPESERPARLLVLDGTWLETRRMLKRLPYLARLPWVSLPDRIPPAIRLRHAPDPRARSTVEAIADALSLLEGPAVAAPIYRAYARFVEGSLRARGTWPHRLAAHDQDNGSLLAKPGTRTRE